MTPEREYLLVTEFFDGAEEIGDAEVDDDVIDQGLRIVRQLWDAGLAHRDIKPANLLVQNGRVRLIDVFFVQVRPSPWRQAVDLANMMLVLAVRSDAPRVYQRALRYFTPDEIAEAFAAAPRRGQSDAAAHGDEARPARPVGAVPRDGAGATTRVVAALELAAGAVDARASGRCVPCLQSHGEPVVAGRPRGGTGQCRLRHERRHDPHGASRTVGDVGALRRVAPCRVDARRSRGRARSWVVLAGLRPRRKQSRRRLPPWARRLFAFPVLRRCRATRPECVASNDPSDSRRTSAPCGCTASPAAAPPTRVEFDGAETASLLFDIDTALAFQDRAALVERVRTRSGLRLCGADVPCPGGSQ